MYQNNKTPFKISIPNTNHSISLFSSTLTKDEATNLFVSWLNYKTSVKTRTNYDMLGKYFTDNENPFWSTYAHSSFCANGEGTESNPFTVQFVK